jgi:hypothetical protein
LMGETNFFWHPALQPLGSFRQLASCRSSSKITGKTNLQSILNKNSPQSHMELEFNVFGVARKLVTYVVH